MDLSRSRKILLAIVCALVGAFLPVRPLLAFRGEEAALGVAVIGMIVLFFLLFVGAIYAYFALAISTIARKTYTPNAWYAWVPILNMVLLLNVAKKPAWWVLLYFVPFVNIVIMVITWMEVAKARGRPDWWGVFIIAPIANFILPGILAWTD
jgi:hypothetical protein